MVYLFLAQGFEEIEAVTPVDVLRRACLEVTTVGFGGKTVTGAHNIAVSADIDEAEFSKVMQKPEGIEMIVLPGGMPGTKNLEENGTVQAAIDYCAENGVYIAAICAAPTILGNKGLLGGKRATCYSGLENKLAGAIETKEETAVDGKFITSKGPGTAMDFALTIVEILKGKETRSSLEKSLLRTC